MFYVGQESDVQTEDQQVIQSLRQANHSMTAQLVEAKIEGALVDGKVLTILLTVITIIRFFVRRRRLAARN